MKKHQKTISSKTKVIPLYHKIDFFGTIFALWLVWESAYMVGAFRSDIAKVLVPLEMVLHGPISLNITKLDDDGERAWLCNPHFLTFLSNGSYFSASFKGPTLAKARSELFLLRPDVRKTWQQLLTHTNVTRMYLGVRLSQVCEYRLPNLDIGACITYSEIQSKCLQNICSADGANLCWWKVLTVLRLILGVQFAVFLFGGSSLLLTIFDPPPFGFHYVVHPVITGITFCMSALTQFVYSAMLGLQLDKYLNQRAFYEAYPATSNSGYAYQYADAYTLPLVGGIVNIVIGFIYLYLSFFSPKYPRAQHRIKIRRQNFTEGLNKLRMETVATIIAKPNQTKP